MNKALRYSLSFSLLTVMAACLVIVLVCAKRQRAMTACNALQVEFRDSLGFVSEGDIQRFLEKRYGPYIGQRLDSVRLGQIEEMMEEKSIVMDCEAWTTDDGTLHVSISQRKPLVRFEDGEKGFYLDAQGWAFPLHRSYTAPVRVVKGDLPHTGGDECESWKKGLLELVGAIDESPVWKDRIEEISARKNGDIVLKVAERQEQIVLGWPEEISDKFGRMERYFRDIAPKREGYKSVNLKYNNQIICRKDI